MAITYRFDTVGAASDHSVIPIDLQRVYRQPKEVTKISTLQTLTPILAFMACPTVTAGVK
jgi:hypothetical protein